ncbi:MAG: hypothetical protein M3444_02830 [Acidobacteriota bacterium]|nr:hypothetical protein [Acidobacteriota bacterium]
MSKRVNRVVNLDEQKMAARLREAELFAEACAKDEPSAEARAYIDGLLERGPDEWRKGGDLQAGAFDSAFKGFWLGYYTKASVRKGAEQFKRELGYDEATPAERVLIEHAVLCHVRLGMIEHLYSRHTSGRTDITEHYEKRLTLAQRRFTRAVETLARVRALLARAEAARHAAERAKAGRQLALARKAG